MAAKKSADASTQAVRAQTPKRGPANVTGTAGPPAKKTASPEKKVHFDPNAPTADAVPKDLASNQLLSEQEASRGSSPAKPSPEKSSVRKRSQSPAKKKAAPVKTHEQEYEDTHDKDLMDKLTALRSQIEAFCKLFFDFNIKGPIEPALASASPELIRYIGCIALGGPKGREGWRELIEDVSLRKALVNGIISRVLHEHVIVSLYFGADKALSAQLAQMEKDQIANDGFFRADARNNAIAQAKLSSEGRELGIGHLTCQLDVLLRPIFELGNTGKPPSAYYLKRLRQLVVDASNINWHIRHSGATVYYFQPVFKDEDFDPHYMTCINLRAMQDNCPYPGDEDEDGDEAEANDSRGDPTDAALVRIVCSYGCVAYRPGGGDLGKQLLEAEKDQVDLSVPPELREEMAKKKNEYYGRTITHKDGFRSKTIAKAVVACRYGRPQFEEEANVRKGYKELQEALEELKVLEKKKKGQGACSVM